MLASEGIARLRTRRRRVVDLELIIPARNEEARIQLTLVTLVAELQRLPYVSVIRVIDNGSCDRTADIVDDLNISSDRVNLSVGGCSPRGKGHAVCRGMLTSTARWVGFCDADLATPATAIAEALQLLDAGQPIVIGSRYAPGARLLKQQSLLRRLGGNAFRTLTSDLVGGLHDTQCGFKFFHGSVAKSLFSDLHLHGFSFDIEVLARAHQMGIPIYEMPVDWSDVDGSSFRPIRHSLEVGRELHHLRQLRTQRLNV